MTASSLLQLALYFAVLTALAIPLGRFMAAVYDVGYDGPVCIEVEDDTFGKTLEGRKNALTVARNILRPFIPA